VIVRGSPNELCSHRSRNISILALRQVLSQRARELWRIAHVRSARAKRRHQPSCTSPAVPSSSGPAERAAIIKSASTPLLRRASNVLDDRPALIVAWSGSRRRNVRHAHAARAVRIIEVQVHGDGPDARCPCSSGITATDAGPSPARTAESLPSISWSSRPEPGA